MTNEQIQIVYKSLATVLAAFVDPCACGNPDCENEAKRLRTLAEVSATQVAFQELVGVESKYVCVTKIEQAPIVTDQQGNC